MASSRAADRPARAVPHAPGRAARRLAALGVAAVALGRPVGAQQPAPPAPAPAAPEQGIPRDTATVRRDSVAPLDTARARAVGDSLVRADSVAGAGAPARGRAAAAPVTPQPPISARRAFLYSVLVPGLGQSRLDRQTAGALFVAVEAGVLTMARKALLDLRTAKRLRADTVVLSYPIDPVTGLPATPTRGAGIFTRDLVRARQLHYEDWIALLLFNHIFAGAEAFVAANLWDLPTQVTARPAPDGRGTALAVRVAW